jgi:hypothetical protein
MRKGRSLLKAGIGIATVAYGLSQAGCPMGNLKAPPPDAGAYPVGNLMAPPPVVDAGKPPIGPPAPPVDAGADR